MQTIDVQVCDAGGVDDYRVVLRHAEITVADVFEALGLDISEAIVDGCRILAPHTTPARQVLKPGGRLSSSPGISGGGYEKVSASPGDTAGALEVSVVAGLNAGEIVRLPPGLHQIVAADESGWYVQVHDEHETTIKGVHPWHHSGSSIEAVATTGGALALGAPTRVEPIAGRVVHRPPRQLPTAAVQPIALAEPPAQVKAPSPLSWVTLLAPVPIALLMAVFFRPIFALFAAMGPVMALGRWYESRRRFRRDSQMRALAVEALQVATAALVRDYVELEAQRRWLTHPHVAELWRRSRSPSVRLWERRPQDPGFLEVGLGVSPDVVAVALEGATIDPEVHGSANEPQRVRAVPHTVDLLTNLGIGMHGERGCVLAAARAAVLQLATLHGPADMRIGAVVTPESATEWDWLKWLPHHDPALSAEAVRPVATALAKPVAGAAAGPMVTTSADVIESIDLIVVDAPGSDVAALQRAALVSGRHARFLVVAEHSTRLPAACSSLIAVASTVAELATPELGGRRQLVVPVGVSSETAIAWARSMASLVDPEVVETATPAAEGVGLLGLLGFQSADQIARSWLNRPVEQSPVAVLGATADAAFSIDLVHDGPHALVAGTTGSGKSELLRTLVLSLASVCPPDHLNFVLVDFKGGGAFDAVDQLPHVAGLITDLDEALVVRAISSLRAELQRREQLFRKLGVSDFEQAAQQTSEVLARLVVVIDEFAVLAADYSELMAALVNLAARGRSLGMHLVLATQRPSGIVDQKIRANTNLRIALRVQDALDSQDVIGVADAAAIDRTSPGRAIVSVGGDAPVSVQTAYSGGLDPRSNRCEVRPHSLLGSRQTQDDKAAPAAPTELVILVDAIVQASQTRAVQVRPLWAEPLPASLDWIDLGARVLGEGHGPEPFSAAMGLADLPETQDQRPWRWVLDSGPLAIYGADGRCSARVLVSLGAALASSAEPDALHLYVVDGDGAGVGPLQGLPHTGAYITGDEGDRIDRVLRLFESALQERRSPSGTPGARMVLIIDNLASVLAGHDELVAAAIVDRLGALARDGSKQRLHLVVAARAVREIGHRLAQQIPNRLAMDLADPASYLSLGLKAQDIVSLQPMRAIDLATSQVVQLVEPPDMSSWSRERAPSHSSPRPIGSFPAIVDRSEMSPTVISEDGTVTIPLGIESLDLTEALLRLRPAEHVLIAGGPGMGRSELCCTIAHALVPSRVSPSAGSSNAGSSKAVRVIGLEPRGTTSGMLGSIAGVQLVTDISSLEQLAAADRRTILVVDDAHLVGDEWAAVLEGLVAARSSLVSVVAATTFEFARSHRGWTRGIRSGGTGVLLGASSTDGDLLRVRLAPAKGLGVLPGRGHLVSRGRVQIIQVAGVAATGQRP